MSKLILGFFITILAFGLLFTDAEARRFGGGKSFGQSRSFSNQNAYRAQPTAKPAATGNRWLGPLAGLAAGGLLASLFMGHGLGSGIMSWLLIGGLIFLILRLVSRFRMPISQSQSAAFQQADTGRVITNTPFTSQTHYDTSSAASAPGFDESEFLRDAKTTFIRLQAAYDAKNLTDIREFTAPEVFAEVQMQIQEQSDKPNQTDVITIDAELLDLDLQSNNMTASVRFTGLIRETAGSNPDNIKEIWHFAKDKFSQRWLVAGIQQV